MNININKNLKKHLKEFLKVKVSKYLKIPKVGTFMLQDLGSLEDPLKK